MKWLINIIVLIAFGYLLFWNNQDLPVDTKKIVAADEISYPSILLKWQQRLILSKSSLVKIYENSHEIMIEISIIKNQTVYKYIYIEDKNELFYKSDNINLFAFEVIVMDGEHIVFQFNGERYIEQPLGNQYQKIDILAYMSGIWEKELIQVASVQ